MHLRPEADFTGCKVALVCGDALLTYLRDDRPGLPWPGMWDLPGGGREGLESPEACVLREVEEEFGLRLAPERLEWCGVFPAMTDPDRQSVFYAGRIAPEEIAAIRFGCEGQSWRMMDVAAFLVHPLAVPALQQRVAVWMKVKGFGDVGIFA